jgi:hypothetical protein
VPTPPFVATAARFDYPPPPPPQSPPPVVTATPPAPATPFYSQLPSPPLPDDDPPATKTTKRKPVDRPTSGQRTSRFGDWMHDYNPFHEGCFESDHCFDNFISPMSNPFLFEDPRSLTEVRPIFLYQTIPGSNPVFRGGNAEFFGLQARLAITDQWSIVMNKLGGVSINPGSDSLVPGGTGFSEFWIGPKWTFLRDTQSGTVAATGLTFQIPTGSSKVYQDTGDLSLVPYVTAAQNFCHSSYGSFNVMDTLGFALRTDNQRSNYFFNSIHLDYDVGNLHRVYPLIELNWFYYTNSGGVRDFATEGRDLANIGSTGVSGQNNFSIATGARYKFSENLQTGLVLEFPLSSHRELFDFRLGIDLIWRY